MDVRCYDVTAYPACTIVCELWDLRFGQHYKNDLPVFELCRLLLYHYRNCYLFLSTANEQCCVLVFHARLMDDMDYLPSEDMGKYS
ncbi:hypothetical protein D3C87_1185950 [compost metagenome]